jgi:copper chaperone NosL
MRRESRVLTGLAALLLLPAFVLPLWSIRLVAPQYREGLGMFIGIRDIWGHSQFDIQNINILNHYIGMKPIVPAEVGLLEVMPWALAGLIVLAALTAVIGRRWLLGVWLAAFVGLGAAGLFEFRAWNYDYGHNLSADAPIKVPGMTYQPPIIGATQLLNIRATSYPASGTFFVTLAFLAGVLALRHDIRPIRRPRRAGPADSGRKPARDSSTPLAAAALVVLVVAAGCGRPASATVDAVPEFAPGGVASDYCDGVIPEARFGGTVETTEGTVYRFMSVECTAGFLLAGSVAPEQVRAVRVVDFNHGERLIDVGDALFVRSQFRPSPNGLNLLASDSEKIAANLHRFFGGERLDWDGVLAFVRKEWNL